jgi:hypothetical protein
MSDRTCDLKSQETYSTTSPICPYCAHEHQHDGGYFYDQMLTDIECDSCSNRFGVEVYVSTSWRCTPLDARAALAHAGNVK